MGVAERTPFRSRPGDLFRPEQRNRSLLVRETFASCFETYVSSFETCTNAIHEVYSACACGSENLESHACSISVQITQARFLEAYNMLYRRPTVFWRSIPQPPARTCFLKMYCARCPWSSVVHGTTTRCDGAGAMFSRAGIHEWIITSAGSLLADVMCITKTRKVYPQTIAVASRKRCGHTLPVVELVSNY